MKKTNCKILFLILFSALALLFSGCDFESRHITEQSTDPLPTLKPYGQIAGVILNSANNQPVKGVVITISFNGQTVRSISDEMGYYAIQGVPITEYRMIDGRKVASGEYTVTASCVEYNKDKPDSLKYRHHYFKKVSVLFTTTSGNDSLIYGVENMTATLNFELTYLNSSVSGNVVDRENKGVKNAIVYLYDYVTNPPLLMQQTITDSTGSFLFSNVDEGLKIGVKAVSFDGNLEGSLPVPYQMQYNNRNYRLRPEVSNERIELKSIDNQSPYVVLATPEFANDVMYSTDFRISYAFSEPIKQTFYTRSDLPKGSGTMLDDILFKFDGLKKANAEIPLSVNWNSSFTEISIIPGESLTSGKYTFDFRAVLLKLKDQGDRFVVENPNIRGDLSEPLVFSVNQGLRTTAVPILSSQGSINFNGGTIQLFWSNYSDPNARSFNLYRSVDNQPFQLLASDLRELNFINSTGALVYPSSSQIPFRAFSVKYKVKAVSLDLYEGESSNILEIRDTIAPQIDTLSVVNSASSILDTLRYNMTFAFPEPMIASDLSNLLNYSLSGPEGLNAQVLSVKYKGLSPSSKYEVEYVLQTNRRFRTSEYIYLSCNNIKDLAGNTIDPSRNKIKIRGYF